MLMTEPLSTGARLEYEGFQQGPWERAAMLHAPLAVRQFFLRPANILQSTYLSTRNRHQHRMLSAPVALLDLDLAPPFRTQTTTKNIKLEQTGMLVIGIMCNEVPL